MIIISFQYVRKSKIVVWPAWCTSQSYKGSILLDKNIKLSVKTVWHCREDHQKCNEQVTPNVWYHHAKFHIYHIQGVWENPNVKVFDKPTLDQPKTCKLSPLNTHTWVAQSIMFMIFLNYALTIHLKYNGQESNQESNKQCKHSDDSHSSAKLQVMLVMSPKYITVTHNILCLIFLTCVSTMHHKTTVDTPPKKTKNKNF